MTAKKDADIDFTKLQTELDEISTWFEKNEDVDPAEALEKYRRSVEIVKTLRSYLAGIENEFKAISSELENEE